MTNARRRLCQWILTALLGALSAYLLWINSARAPDLAAHIYGRFCRKLKRRGIERRPSEGPLDFARRAALAMPTLAADIDRITSLYLRIRYGEESSEEMYTRLRGAVGKFKA